MARKKKTAEPETPATTRRTRGRPRVAEPLPETSPIPDEPAEDSPVANGHSASTENSRSKPKSKTSAFDLGTPRDDIPNTSTPNTNARKRRRVEMETLTPAVAETPTARRKVAETPTARRKTVLPASVKPESRPLSKPWAVRGPSATNGTLNGSAKTTVKTATQMSTSATRLQDLQETQAEQLLAEYKEQAEKRFAAADELISALSETEAAKYATVNEQLAQAVSSLTGDVEAAAEEIRILRAQLESKEKESTETSSQALSLVSHMTGLVVMDVVGSDEATTYQCLQSGRNGAFRYDLAVSHVETDQSPDVTFTPLLDTETDELISSLLPNYFTEPLSFTREAAPQFYWKIAQALNRK